MLYLIRTLKRILPENLQGRFALIIIVPIISIQLIATFVFYERHWKNVSEHLVMSVGYEIIFLLSHMQHITDLDRILHTSRESNLHLLQTNFYPHQTLDQLPRDSYLEPDLIPLDTLLREKTPYPFSIHADFPETDVKVYVELPDGLAAFHISRKRLYTPTTYIYILWMMGAAIVFITIAMLFMRNQVRSILRLADASERFGKGQAIDEVHASGATEVRQAFHAFRIMKNRIERYITQRTEMLAGVSHDLRTPITRMKLQLEMLDHPSAAGLKQDIAELEDIIQAYLDFAKDESEEEVEPCSLQHLIEEVAAGYPENKGALKVAGKTQSILMLRAGAMKRVISNLINNALRYGQEVKVFLSEMNRQVKIVVEDNGPGIPEEQRSEVFKPFVRLEGSRNVKTGGVGLGLAIVKDIITSHGGTITIEESSELGGARVVITLPS